MSDVVTERFHVVEKGIGGDHDSVVMEQYIPPPGNEEDPYYESDKELMNWVRAFLVTRFPVGYEWCVRSDLRQKVVLISIPLLMGVNQWMIINLTKTSLGHGVLMCAGEILERYRLSRSKFNLAELLDARSKHSALVIPRRAVPV